jgi:hypothetical protein
MMLKTWIGSFAVIASMAGCAGFGPSAQQQAVRIENTPGVGVIYLVRTKPDLSYVPATFTLDDRLVGTSYAGTYYRLEVPAGRHRLSGYGGDTGGITLDVQPDRVYFVQQSVAGSWRSPSSLSSFFTQVDEQRGRTLLARTLYAG